MADCLYALHQDIPDLYTIKTIKNKVMKTQMKNTFLRSSLLIISIVLISACGRSESRPEQEKAEVPQLDLFTSVLMGDYDAVVQHIKAGTDLNQVEPEGGSTPLITAIVFGKTDISKALIDAGADLEIKNNEGATALMVAALFCRTETLKLLLEAGADPTATDNYGGTALKTAEIPFESIKPIYDEISKGLGPLGLKLDYKRLEDERPVVANILKSHSNNQ